MDEFTYDEKWAHCYNACLNITDACNLECIYCFVQQQPHFMSLKTAKEAAAYLVNNYNWQKERGYIDENQKITLTYFGGEPTLLFDEIIAPLTMHIVDTYPGLFNFTVTTNGTLLTPERIDFLKAYEIFPLLSIDGCPECQNINRPCRDKSKNSFDLIAPNILYLLANFPNITFRSTIAKETVDQVFNNYVFAAAAGFSNCFMIPNGRDHWTTEQIIQLGIEVRKIYDLLLDRFKKEKMPFINCSPIDESFKNVLLHDIAVLENDESWKAVQRPLNRCGLGTVGCSIGYDGTIYGCQEQDSQDSKSLFTIGNIYDGIDIEKHKKLLWEQAKTTTIYCEDKELCQYCELRNICKDFPCPSSSWSIFQDTSIMHISQCMWKQFLFENASRIMKILVEENNQTFKQYLSDFCQFSNYLKEE